MIVKQNDYGDIPLNKMRIHYFFSENNQIEKFLQNTEIAIRLTQNGSWTKFISEGKSKTIQHF